jgi:hypothetical protein
LFGVFQQQSFLIGVPSAHRTDTHGLSEDLLAVDGSIQPIKLIAPERLRPVLDEYQSALESTNEFHGKPADM